MHRHVGDSVLYHRGLREHDLRGLPRDLQTPADAALALEPFGQYAKLLFAAGLFNASLLPRASCLSRRPIRCAKVWASSPDINRRFREAPIFYWLFTLLIVIGGAVVMWPRFPLVKMILFSQVINGVLLPVVLIFMTLLINKKKLMHEWINSRFYNFVSWAAVALMVGPDDGAGGVVDSGHAADLATGLHAG